MMSDCCPICLKSMKKAFGCIVPCGHCVHVKCYELYVRNHLENLVNLVKNNNVSSLDITPRCPTCRSGVCNFQRVYLTIDDKCDETAATDDDDESIVSMDEDPTAPNATPRYNEQIRYCGAVNDQGCIYYPQSSKNPSHLLGGTIIDPFLFHINEVLRKATEQSIRTTLVQREAVLLQREVIRLQRVIIEQALIDHHLEK